MDTTFERKCRKIRAILEPEETSDGAGVALRRAIGNRKFTELDPFLLLDHFGSEDPDEYIAGFPMHPHRGIETVTYMLKGLIKHKDSSGNEGVIGEGDVQWMTAGSGIMHEEMPQIKEGKMEGFQLWVNLPSKDKMMKPRYQEFRQQEIPVVEKANGVRVRIIAGKVDETEGVVRDIQAEPTYMDVVLPANSTFKQEVPKGHNVFAYIFRGEGYFGISANDDRPLIKADRLVVFDDGDCVEVESRGNGLRFLLVSGKPLNEPIARYGPFVMNTQTEIREALDDLQRGTFVKP